MKNQPVRIGIAGYGNLGKGAEKAIQQSAEMELKAVFTRRDPASLKLSDPKTPAYRFEDLDRFREEIDVLLLCGGSKTDLPSQGPELASKFNTVDSFDTHAKIPGYFEAVDRAAKSGGKTSIIAVGWDPGLFSLQRLLGEAILPNGKTSTFWGKGVSQGHSQAVREIPGVKAAVQYTIPNPEAIDAIRNGKLPDLSKREKHARTCFVVLEPGADRSKIERTIVSMPDYFADFDTTVHFISEEELREHHSGMPHGGFVFRTGKTGENHLQTMEFALKLESNPEFTASVLVASARAAHRLHRSGKTGAHTLFDIPPALLSPQSPSELRKNLL